MKKTLKITALLMIVAIMLLSLAGCGKDKIVATKSTSEENSMFGAYDEKIEVTFKKEKVDKIVWTMEFKDEETANSMSGLYQLASSELKDLEIKQDGKNVVLTMGAESFASQSDMNKEDLTKDQIVKELEEQGYTVKK